MFKKILALLIFVLLTANLSFGQVGITSARFLQISPDSRATGMGNTGAALADNASAIYWNPAGLGFQRGNEVYFTHSQWLQQLNAGLSFEYLVGKTHFDGIGTFGANITYLNLGDQVSTDINNNVIGEFSSDQYAIDLSYGRELSKNWSVGAGAKFIHSNLGSGAGNKAGSRSNPASTVAFDLASLYKTDSFEFLGRTANFNVGLNISNIGSGLKYSDSNSDTAVVYKDPLPTTLRVGWSYTTNLDENGINTLTITNDISKIMARTNNSGKPLSAVKALFKSWDKTSGAREPDGSISTLTLAQQLRVGTGLEYWYNNLFALRTGYYYEDPNNGDRQFLTLGAGLRYKSFGIDFSYINTLGDENSPLANTTRFGLSINF